MGLFDRLFGGKKKPAAKAEAPAKASAKPSGRQDNVNVDLSGLEEGSKVAQPKPVDSTNEEETAVLRKGKAAEVVSKRESNTSIARRKRSSISRRLLGNLLLAAEAIDKRQLKAALDKKEKEGGLLGQILIEMGVCSLADLEAAINKQRTITTVDITQIKFDESALRLCTREICETHCLIPFQMMGKMLCVAMNNVLDSEAKETIREYAQTHVTANSKTEDRFKLKLFDAAWQQINEAIESQYPSDGTGVDLDLPPGAREIASPKKTQADKEIEIKIDLPGEESADSPAPEAAAPLQAIPAAEELAVPAQMDKEGEFSERWQADRTAQEPVPAEPVPAEPIPAEPIPEEDKTE